LLTLPSVLAVFAALLAVVAHLRARRVAKRLQRLVESYWELRYDYGQLRARVARLEGQPESESQPSPPGAQAGSSTFVPLSSVKR
jgi:hypothetical protein